jgi:hypothetical protein
MNKKILGIIAASAAAIGSAIIASPADAQTANLDVELEVQPSVYLVTYSKLKLLVSSNDLLGNPSVSQTAEYDEKSGTSVLPAGSIGTPGTTLTPVTKTIKPLYRVSANSGATVTLNASNPTLVRDGGASSDTVTMEVDTASKTKSIPVSATGAFVDGDATLKFTFNGSGVPSGTTANPPMYKGGRLTISVATP